jgi:hypothetical protein
MHDETIDSAPRALKQRELGRLVGKGCAWCGKREGMLQPVPFFWRLTVDRFGVDAQAVRRQHGLGVAIGSAALAAVMGPDEDMGRPLMATAQIVVCEPCMTGPLVKLCAAVMP